MELRFNFLLVLQVDRDGIGMGISIPTDSTAHGVPPGAIQARPTLRNAGLFVYWKMFLEFGL